MSKKITFSARKIFSGCLLIFGGVCLLSVVLAGISNAAAPRGLSDPEVLNPEDLVLWAEADHLRRELGGQIWPGWESRAVPAVYIHGERAFLVGLDEPQRGWVKPLSGDVLGSDWLPFGPNEFGEGLVYTQAVPNADREIGSFTVRVGNTWAVSMQTREWSRVRFRQGFGEELPPFVRAVLPVHLISGFLLGGPDRQVTYLLHEAFHAHQAGLVLDRLEAAERSVRLEGSYPWEDETSETGWNEELGYLAEALRAEDLQAARNLALQFVDRRDRRRVESGLSADLIDMERQREWLEGLAKYVELEAARLAAETPGYTPLPAARDAAGLKSYASARRFSGLQAGQVATLTQYDEEVRFYYSGAAQAQLLDRLLPGWKERAFDPGVFLEDLVRDAVD